MTPERLRVLGEAMFGTYWQAEMARELGRSSRLVRFWASGARAVDGDVVEGLARRRLEKLKELV